MKKTPGWALSVPPISWVVWIAAAVLTGLLLLAICPHIHQPIEDQKKP